MPADFDPYRRTIVTSGLSSRNHGQERQYRCRAEQLQALVSTGCDDEFVHCCVPPYQFFVTRMPNRRGSVRKTLVVSPVSSLFRNAPVMAVVSNAFLT